MKKIEILFPRRLACVRHFPASISPKGSASAASLFKTLLDAHAQAQGIGNISKSNSASSVEFRVNILKELVNVILPHFDNYPGEKI